MAEGAGCTIELWPGRVSIVPQALELARDGIIPAGAYRNLEFAGPEVETAGTFPQAVLDCLYDPQTSGGLLLAIAEERGAELLRRLADAGVTAAAVGRCAPGARGALCSNPSRTGRREACTSRRPVLYCRKNRGAEAWKP